MVEPANHAEVLRLLSKRNRDLGRQRARVICRLHSLCAELVPGGIAKEMYVSDAEALLEKVTPETPVQQMRYDLVLELLDDVRRLDTQTKESHRRIRTAVKASGTSVTEIYGVGPDPRRDDHRLFGRHTALCQPGCLCLLQRHGTDRTLLRWTGSASTFPERLPQTQPCASHGCRHSDPQPWHGGAHLLRSKSGRGQDDKGSAPIAKAPDLQRRVSPAGHRRRKGAGRTLGNDSKPAWSALHPEGRLFGEVTPGPPKILCICAVS